MPKRRAAAEPESTEAVEATPSTAGSNKKSKPSAASASSDVEKALVAAGYKVTINGEKPRKGCFVVTREGQSKPIVEFLNMPRPFAPLRALDVEQLVQDILSA
eukprot:gene23979-29026_t